MKQKGFTLLELSIVIVIIGLIVAGISAGQSLVQQAKLRSLVSESGNILTAVNSFRMQYDALPGDMNTAQSYWGVYAGGFGGTGVTNGDGNGVIGAGAGFQAQHREGKQSMR